MISNNDLNQAIVIPNRKAADVKLGTTKKTLRNIWGNPVTIEQISSEEEKWEYENVTFWIESNKVTQIRICNLYEGKTKEGIGLGSTKTEVEDIYGSLMWEGTWHIQTPPFGIGFDFERDLMGEKFVSDIFVFNE